MGVAKAKVIRGVQSPELLDADGVMLEQVVVQQSQSSREGWPCFCVRGDVASGARRRIYRSFFSTRKARPFFDRAHEVPDI